MNTITTEDKCRAHEELLDAETRREYEEARSFFAEKLSALAKEVADSERLSKDDFAIRINAKMQTATNHPHCLRCGERLKGIFALAGISRR